MISRLMARIDNAIDAFLSAVIDHLERAWIEKGK